MIRFLFIFMVFLLVAGPGYAHDGMGGEGHANAVAVHHSGDHSNPAMPPGHRHSDSTSFHCSVSVSCAPLFTQGDVFTMPSGIVFRSWGVLRQDLTRALPPERDPPVPRT